MSEGYESQPFESVLNNNTFTTPTPITGRGTIVSGGYITFGKILFVSVVVKALVSLSNEPSIVTIPTVASQTAITCLENTYDSLGTALGESIPCGCRNTGIYVKQLVEGKYYFISGVCILN